MKNLFICLGFLVSCSALAGGVSGGGGGVKPAHPVTRDEVLTMARDARMYVMFYFNRRERVWHWSQDPIDAKLFNGPVSIVNKILEVPVTLEQNGACLDPEGNEMDGSAIGAGVQSVCLSIPRLTEKLSQESLRSQTFALLAHEYSHLVGLNEEEANQLQENSISAFLYGDYQTVNEQFRDLVSFRNFGIEFLKSVPEALNSASWADIHELVTGEEYRKIMTPYLTGRTFTLFPQFMVEDAEPVQERFALLEAASCALGKLPGKEKCRALLKKVFRGDAEISYATLAERMGWRDFVDHPGVVYRRVTNKENARVEFLRLNAELVQLENYIKALRGY